MKKIVSLDWVKYKNPVQEDCWRLVINLPKGKIRLGFVCEINTNKYNVALDLCNGGLVKINYLKSEESLEEAKDKIYGSLFLKSMSEDNMMEEINFDWDTEVCPKYKDKTFTLVGMFPGRRIRFAHIRLDMSKSYVMFIDYGVEFRDVRCIGKVDDLEIAKETVLENCIRKLY